MSETLLGKLGRIEVYATMGDITQISTPAIMTAINSGGLWFGGVDGAIQRISGNHYHAQALAHMPLKDLDVVIAKGGKTKHSGKFKDVVFVVDDLESPLQNVVYTGLEAVHNESYNKVLIPSMRMGVMLGVVEKTPQEAVDRMNKGVRKFADKYGANTQLNNLTFVVYNDQKTMSLLEKRLKF